MTNSLFKIEYAYVITEVCMFNFFNEIKSSVKKFKVTERYNIINISGQIVYVEGHKGITLLSSDVIAFRVKAGRINIYGKNLSLSELADDTLKVSGMIDKIEADK